MKDDGRLEGTDEEDEFPEGWDKDEFSEDDDEESIFPPLQEEPPDDVLEELSVDELDYLFEVYDSKDTKNKQKKKEVTWDLHRNFSSEFLSKNCNLVLHDVFHHIKAFLLYPPDCLCVDTCHCHVWRKKVILSLNTNLYNRADRIYAKPRDLRAMKYVLCIPEDHAFRKLHSNAYPLWLIENKLKEKKKHGHFKAIEQMGWTFLRVGGTFEQCLGYREASLKEAMDILVGDTPIKSKTSKTNKMKKAEYLGGQKKYEQLFKHYKSVCHFIAALVLCKKEDPYWKWEHNYPDPPAGPVERFLSVAHWFRSNLLALERRNVKNKVFLREEDLCPLPDWVHSNDVNPSIEPYEEKIQEIESQYQIIDPKIKALSSK